MSAAPVIVKISTPADIVATVPHFVGFHPQESLVVMSLRGPRKRSGLTVRVDLPPPEEHAGLAAYVAPRIVDDGASAALVVVYTDAADEAGVLPRRDLVDRQIEELLRSGLGVLDALLVRRGRWWCYHCTEGCCPPEGTPLPDVPTGAAAHVAAEAALEGKVVLRDRGELEALVRGPRAPQQAALDRLYDERAGEFLAALEADSAAHDQATQYLLRELVDRRARGDERISDEDAVRVVLGFWHEPCRDRVMTWALEAETEALTDVLCALARMALDDVCAPVCTLVATMAYAEGHGALANVALDRALTAHPQYTMATYLRAFLDRQWPPDQLQGLLRDMARTFRDDDVVRRSARAGRRRGATARAAARRRARGRRSGPRAAR